MYAIFNCIRTFELFEEYKDTHHVRIPLERRRIVCPKTHKQLVKISPAMSGLVFVPQWESKEFSRQVPEWYRLKQMSSPVGRPHLVDPKVLADMQRALDDEFYYQKNVTKPEDDIWFKCGDIVEIAFHTLFQGLKGEVQRVKKDGTVRIRVTTGLQFVEIPKKYLRICT